MKPEDRKFSESHPWLTFNLNSLQQAGPMFWMLMGEAQSKIEHIAGTPLRPNVSEELHKLFPAKGAAATTAIEGNPLTEEQVRASLDKLFIAPPSQEYIQQEVNN
jgi:hypothetical protein